MPESPPLALQPPSAELSAKIANTIRFLSADGVQKANSGHPGLPMGSAEIATVLMTRFLRIDPKDDKWLNRDRFVLSAGHASMLLYSMLYLQGFLTLEDLKNFRQLDSRTPGHPEHGDTPGVEATTGPLGAGFAMAAGMALAERMLAEAYNTPKFDIVDHYTYVLMGDGCHMEGVTNEAASLAGHLKLGRLIAIYDDNGISIEGNTDLAFTENVGMRYEALGWQVQDIDGHDCEAIARAIENAQAETSRPSLIVAHTTIGKGAPHKQGTHGVHGEPLGAEELAAAKAGMGWPAEDFHVPQDVLDYFDVRRGEWMAIRNEWNDLFAAYEKKHRSTARELLRVASGELPKQWKKACPEYAPGKAIATRVSGGEIMNKLGGVIPELAGGSADLAPSTKTEIKTGQYPDFVAPGAFLGRNIHFGVREHAMGWMTDGMALHGGFIPFCATFMVFHDYMRPSVRLAALMRLRSIFVYTHDSIYVGEDGPTHEPIEHLASLRAIPRVQVWRPCDANEAIYAWQSAIERKDGPTCLAMTRQNLMTLDREKYAPARDALKGMYVIDPEGEKTAEILIVATGSEVHLALAVADALRGQGRGVRVVSAPCLEAFKLQAEGYRKKVFPKRLKKRLVIEAGVEQGWEGTLGESGLFVGMDDFGYSGPAAKVAGKCGFAVPAILEKIAQAAW
ncbi:MAG: transketolase [Planctomycetota bacterium]|jgi:transketolase|nr:transketolase [Planctomycetota bacterium]